MKLCTLEAQDVIVYLGCHFNCNIGEVDPSCFLGKFYGAFNNIVNVLGTRRDEMLAVHLVKTYCLPSLLYGCETWHLNNTDTKSIDSAWNNAFRKIFNGYWRECVKPLQFYCPLMHEITRPGDLPSVCRPRFDFTMCTYSRYLFTELTRGV